MPIRPSERARYPRDWKAISKRVRERAGNRCECTIECGATHLDDDGNPNRCNAPNGKLIIRHRFEPEFYEVHPPCGGCVGGDPDCARAVRVVLTVAHLDHTPEHNDPSNLKAMCQRCHLRMDGELHAKNARETRRARKAAGDLFAVKA
jgi:hypothetical protein